MRGRVHAIVVFFKPLDFYPESGIVKSEIISLQFNTDLYEIE